MSDVKRGVVACLTHFDRLAFPGDTRRQESMTLDHLYTLLGASEKTALAYLVSHLAEHWGTHDTVYPYTPAYLAIIDRVQQMGGVPFDARPTVWPYDIMGGGIQITLKWRHAKGRAWLTLQWTEDSSTFTMTCGHTAQPNLAYTLTRP